MNHYEKLVQLATELAQGSARTIRKNNLTAIESIEIALGRDVTMEEKIELASFLPNLFDSGWDVGPYGVRERTDEFGDQQTLSHRDFIGGIAAANAIDPAPQDIDTVIFHLGSMLGDLRI